MILNIEKVPFGMSLVLAGIVLVILAMLWNFHRDKDNQVDLKDLICHNGQVNEVKFTRFGAFIVSTWGFVYLILDGHFSEWYFAGYMAAWCGNALLNKYLSSRDQTNNSQPPKG
jgi:hypothetical protein